MGCLCLLSTMVWNSLGVVIDEYTAKWSRLLPGQCFHCRVTSIEWHHSYFFPDKSSHRPWMRSYSVFLAAAFLCMDPNYDFAGFNPAVPHCLYTLLYPAHHYIINPFTSCTPLSNITNTCHNYFLSLFPRGECAFREEFHSRDISMEWFSLGKFC